MGAVYYSTDWRPLLKAAPYIGLACVLLVVFWAERRAYRWATRPRIYDWQQDPAARVELYRDDALDALARAVDRRPARVRALIDERRASSDLGYGHTGNVIPLPVQTNTPPASSVAEGA